LTTEELKSFYYSTDHYYKNGEDKGLGWCGCGEPWAAIRFLGDVLEALDDDRSDCATQEESDNRYLLPFRMCGGNVCPGLAYGYLYTLDGVGLTDHGSNIRGSWLTDKGREVLEAINNCTEEEWDKNAWDD
jgi:hypothetical protein